MTDLGVSHSLSKTCSFDTTPCVKSPIVKFWDYQVLHPGLQARTLHLWRVEIEVDQPSGFLLSSLDQLNVSWSMLCKSTSKTKKMFFHLPSRVQLHWFHFSISKHFSEFTTLVRFGKKIHWPNYDNWIYLEYCWHEDILYYLLSVLTACACFETDLWMKAVENTHSKEKQTFSFIQLKRKYSSQLVE